jgi:hypothetical protein
MDWAVLSTTLSLSVALGVPTATTSAPGHSPSITQGSRLLDTPTRFPTPYPTACPILLSWPAHGCNFDIAQQSSSLVSTSVAGYGTRHFRGRRLMLRADRRAGSRSGGKVGVDGVAGRSSGCPVTLLGTQRGRDDGSGPCRARARLAE